MDEQEKERKIKARQAYVERMKMSRMLKRLEAEQKRYIAHDEATPKGSK